MASPTKGFMMIKECESAEFTGRISYSPVKNKETFIQRKIRLLNEKETDEFHKSPLGKIDTRKRFSRVM